MLHALCSFILSCLIPFLTSAQNYSVIEPQSEVKPYQLNLPNDLVGMNSAVQTPDGFLWITSTRGLIISDGHESVIYTNGNARFPLLLDDPDAFLGRLRLDSLGNVYAVVSNEPKIIRFDQDSRTVAEEWGFKDQSRTANMWYDVSPRSEVFSVLCEQDADTFSIWKMNADAANQLLFEETKTKYGTCLHYQVFQSMHWIQTTTGIMRISMDGKQLVFHPYSNTSPTNLFSSYNRDHYFFYDNGLRAFMYWDAKLSEPRIFVKAPPVMEIQSGNFMAIDEILYVANGYYFFILDTLQRTIQDLSATTYEMKKDFYPGALSEDIMGFRSIDQQVFLLGSKYLYALKTKAPPKEKFQSVLQLNRRDISMRGLAEDEHQNVYASFYNGVVIKKKGDHQFKEWGPAASLNTDLYSAYSLSYKSPYLFWHSLKINTQNGKVSQVVPNQINGHVAHLISGDTLWMYTWYGSHLYMYDMKKEKLDSLRIESSDPTVDDFPSIINKMIMSHGDSAIWMATRSDGIKLVSRQGKVLQSFTVEELGTTRQEGINDILVDGDYLWYGCSDGLGKLNPPTRSITIYKDPLINPAMQQRPRTIYTILPDGQKGFYLGSHQGLVYFDTASLHYAHLHSAHPLSQPEFNRTSAFKDTQGRYYFGSTNGLYSFLPEELEFQSSVDPLHPVRLYMVAIFNGKEKKYRYLTSSLDQVDELRLLPSETNIEFNLSVPSFHQDIYYSYRLKGIHDQWSEYSADPKILFYALPPGRYMLEVKAAVNANDKITSSFQLPIIMAASWYQKTWVWILLSLALSAFVAFWIRYWYQQKWKRQKALEALRIKISSDLHDDVGSILSGLAMQSQVMSYEMEESKRKPMLELSSMSREAMERMRDTVWAIDARKDKYENLLDRMRDFAEKNLERKNITHSFTFHGLEGKKFISPEVRQNIYLIFKEAITNIIRHSDAQHVNIRFSQEGNVLRLAIHDNGTANGLMNEAGQGISNMKMRAGRIGGALTIEPDNGYRVILEMEMK